jgi:phage shock protein PspC (stress-responsive transcriptional regulator)
MKKSSTDKIFAGVCGGLAEYTGVDSLIVRVLTILVILGTGIIPGLIGYVVAAALMK